MCVRTGTNSRRSRARGTAENPALRSWRCSGWRDSCGGGVKARNGGTATSTFIVHRLRERRDAGEDRRVVGEDGVAAVLPGLAQDLVAKLERHQQAANRLVVAADEQPDVAALCSYGSGRLLIGIGV